SSWSLLRGVSRETRSVPGTPSTRSFPAFRHTPAEEEKPPGLLGLDYLLQPSHGIGHLFRGCAAKSEHQPLKRRLFKVAGRKRPKPKVVLCGPRGNGPVIQPFRKGRHQMHARFCSKHLQACAERSPESINKCVPAFAVLQPRSPNVTRKVTFANEVVQYRLIK